MLLGEALSGLVVGGRYRLVERVGEGSYGTVWRAQEEAAGRYVADVAVKLCRPPDERSLERLLREARTMAQLAHDCLIGYRACDAIADGPLAGCFYLAMELAETNLAEGMRDGPAPADVVLVCARSTAECLAHLHSNGAVHRDIKPSNLLRVAGRWKVGDLGLARALDGSISTASGVTGTPAYMAPEMFDGRVGPASDVHALGVTVLEALTGRLPYEGGTPAELMRQILFDQPRVPLGLPDPWAELLPRMLAKRYEDRPTAAEVAARLIDRPTVEPPLPPGLSRGMAKAASRLDPALVPPGALVNEPDGSILAPVPNDGEALLGSEEEEGCPDERPRFRVALPAYYVGLHPVTNAQYKRFVDATGRRAPVSSSAGDSVWNGKECPPELSDHPVVCVSWDDAQAYCSWAGLRLPTELEWEKAARGCDGRRYPWGEEWDAERCRSRRNRGSTGTARVGAYPLGRSPYGVLDMAGNVWEWCADRYDSESYARYAQGDLVPPLVGERRVFRGGSWSGAAYADYCRCAYRGMALASHRHPDLGFRVARSVGP